MFEFKIHIRHFMAYGLSDFGGIKAEMKHCEVMIKYYAL